MKYKVLILLQLPLLVTLTNCSNSSTCYKIQFDEQSLNNHLKYIGDNVIDNNTDYKMSFLIDYNYELLIPNIHVYINGIENNECWSFLYQTNVKNVFTISKEFITADILISAVATYRTSTPSEYGYLFGEEITKICDCRFSDDRQPKFIPTLDQVAYPVMEDDSIEVVMTLKENEKYEGLNKLVFDNIWFRTNARYAKIDVDFTKKYSSNNKECHVYVPHYVIRDHGSFQAKLNDQIGVDENESK